MKYNRVNHLLISLPISLGFKSVPRLNDMIVDTYKLDITSLRSKNYALNKLSYSGIGKVI
jgi:hypothetical protein